MDVILCLNNFSMEFHHLDAKVEKMLPKSYASLSEGCPEENNVANTLQTLSVSLGANTT